MSHFLEKNHDTIFGSMRFCQGQLYINYAVDFGFYLINDQFMYTKLKLLILEMKISELANNYRADWKVDLWESENIEEYGLNEYIGGKAEAYEDCLELIKKYMLELK